MTYLLALALVFGAVAMSEEVPEPAVPALPGP